MKWYELSIGHTGLGKLYIKGNIEEILDDVLGFNAELTPVTNKKKVDLIEKMISQDAKVSNLKLNLEKAEKELKLYKSQLKV